MINPVEMAPSSDTIVNKDSVDVPRNTTGFNPVERLFRQQDIVGFTESNRKGFAKILQKALQDLNEGRVNVLKPQSAEAMMEASGGRPDVLISLLARAGRERELPYPQHYLIEPTKFVDLFSKESEAISDAYDTMLAQPAIVNALRDFTFPQELESVRGSSGVPGFYGLRYGLRYKFALEDAKRATEGMRQKCFDPATGKITPEGEAEIARLDLLAKDTAIEVVLRAARINGDKNVEKILIESPYFQEKARYLQQLDSENPLKRYINKTDVRDTEESDVITAPGDAENFMDAALTLDFSNKANVELLKLLWERYRESLKHIVGIRNRIATRALVLGVILTRFSEIGNIIYGDGTYKPGTIPLIKKLFRTESSADSEDSQSLRTS